MAEVEGGELEEVDDERNFGENEVGAGPEHDPGEVEDVEQDEVGSNRASRIHPS